ncbi:MAG: Cna B-type domain-containing protein, partial [Oscillospiraceae bacterium]|nr:Cna B-type domain-containing protein [Oscillospiraceae bacterium]
MSEMELMGAKPVVYYSTTPDLDVSAYTDQTDPQEGEVLRKIQTSADWSVKPPSDLSIVTAVAIDCTKKADGSDYELDKQETLIAYLYMKAPEYDLESEIFDEEEYYNHLKNRSAYNGFYANTSIRDAIGTAASHSYHIFEFTKTDIYAPKMKIKKKWADNNNNDGKRPRSVRLTLMANGRPSGTTVDLTAEENWEKELGYMRLYDEDGNMIRYTLKEGDVEGYTSDPAVMTVKDGVASIEITNRHENETVDIPFSKTWAPRKEGDEEWEEKIPDSLSFRLSGGTTSKTQTLYKADFDGNTWSGSFTGMQKYRAGQEINYTVKELLESDAWYSERGTGKNDIRNIYYPYGSLEVVKDLVGDTAKAGQKDFVFSISFRSGGEVYRENVPYKIVDRASGEELRSGSFEGSGEFALKKTEKLVIEELGTSVDYEIDEKPLEGFTLESSSKTAGRVSPHTTTTASFTNRYRSGCSVGINGTKTLDGKELKRNQFRFELRDESGRVVSAVGNRADGGISFGDLSYTQKDDGKTFVYRVSEVVQKKGGYTCDGTVYRVYVRPVDNGDGTMDCSIAYKKVTHPGEAAKRAQIEAKQKEIDALLPDEPGYEETLDRLQAELDALELELEAILAGDGEETDADGISFSNTYRAAGSIVLKAYKSLKNGDIGDYSFRFDLYDGEGRLIDSENNNREGNILFEALHFDQKDAGKTYYYAIREHAGDEEAVVYDKKVYGYRIRVIDNNDGTLSFNQAPFNADEMFMKDESGELITDEYGHLVKNESFTEKEGDLPLFKNSMKPGSLSVAKFVDNPD